MVINMKFTKFLFAGSVLLLVGGGCTRSWSYSRVERNVTTDIPAEYPTFKTDLAPNASLSLHQTSYSAEDRQVWYEALKWPASCETEEYNRPADGGLRFYEISADQYLLSVTCNVYAYQATMAFMVLDLDRAAGLVTGTLQTLDTYNPTTKKLEPIIDEDYQAPVVLGFDYFDEATKTLRVFTKSRGVGDCGSAATYKVVLGKLTLIKYEAQSCEAADEFRLKNPEAEEMPVWPVLYERK